ncbi:MAG: sigma-54-dependent Fis family transcriptional regulator [bacterium]|nr:sigma-54-dependent Fis family transcriptional regulator [bacterium]
MLKQQLAKLLVVDDDPSVLEALVSLFIDDYEVISASSGQGAIALAEAQADIAVAVLDIKMEGLDGIETARLIKRIRPNLIIIFHTGYPGDYEEQSIDAAEKPFDFVEKGRSAVRLMRSVRNGVDAYRLKTTGLLHPRTDMPDYGLIGKSQPILRVIREVEMIARGDNRVMILGETGTGKELVANAIHYNSQRASKPMAVLHCNHKSPDLVESELFGHLKGSYTHAYETRKGKFEFANGGTIFLDEIGDLDITTQAKLLRVAQDGTYTPIGVDTTRTTDVRLICATNKNLSNMVKQGTFRDDLFYRLKGVTIELPTLRERKEDIPILVDYFVKRDCVKASEPPKHFDQSAIERLIQYDWPGNVRELMEAVEAIYQRSYSDYIDAAEVDSYLKDSTAHLKFIDDPDSLSGKVEAYKCALIIHAMRQNGGNTSAAAAQLRTDKANLGKYIRDHGLEWE